MQQFLNQFKDIINVNDIIQKDENTAIGQIYLYNQFSDEFSDLIEKFTTTQSICGFTSVGNAIALKQVGSQIGYVQAIQHLKKNSQLRRKYVQDAMIYIQNCRRKYIQQSQWLSQNQKDANNYLKDWVANFEISDYLREKKFENIYFIRNVSWDHPELMDNIKYEEKDRIQEEIPFKGEIFFIDYGFTKQYIRKKDFEYSSQHVYVIDILGHFICSVVLEDKGKKLILLLETMENNRLNNQTIKQFFKI
ncbi:unnamed protein product [Paramecium primaurelia]|uniref:Uncharacterized protein n=1 Tax=Paramecium primaurelia TaxID=5886 RepID=A0A8S1LFY1_PARPR|nr:unnamed protein product [Paramecium primaurelia]